MLELDCKLDMKNAIDKLYNSGYSHKSIFGIAQCLQFVYILDNKSNVAKLPQHRKDIKEMKKAIKSESNQTVKELGKTVLSLAERKVKELEKIIIPTW